MQQHSGRLESVFEGLKNRRRAALVAYLTAGDPDIARSFELAEAVAEAGADVLELGIPFSDPLADGPVIQAASARALRAGASVGRILGGLREFRRRCGVPVVLFSYLNPVFAYGWERFHEEAAGAGADGLLLLDLPPDEAERNAEFVRRQGLAAIQLVAPTTPEARIAAICRAASGFVYYVSREGVTGERQELAASLKERVGVIRKHTRLPICVGFGVSTPEQAAYVAEVADGVVVGSAIVRRIGEMGEGRAGFEDVVDFVRGLAEAVHSAQAGRLA